MEVGDVPGHVMGIIRQTGVLFFTKGRAGGLIGSPKTGGDTCIDFSGSEWK